MVTEGLFLEWQNNNSQNVKLVKAHFHQCLSSHFALNKFTYQQ